jgi:alpha-beta hydrolase superfamily lysophospholipase
MHRMPRLHEIDIGRVERSVGCADRPSSELYQLPPLRGDEALGSVLRSERLQAPDGISAWGILYVSTGLSMARTAISGIVLAPDRLAPEDGRPILAWAHPTAGLAEQCAPSHAGATGELIDIARPFLADGFVVVATDYEGLGTPGPHPYLVGLSEGRSVLDAIRAAQRLPGCDGGAHVAVLGLSQGGHAALWAAELAPFYAPELWIDAVVAAAPGGDLAAISSWIYGPDGSAVSWLNAVIVLSAWHVVYGLPLESVLTPKGHELAFALRSTCPDYAAAPTEQPLLADPSLTPGWSEQIAANTPGATRALAPILIVQGTADEQVPLQTTLCEVRRLRQAGDHVELRLIEGGDHEASLFGPGLLAEIHGWIAERLEGSPWR